MVEEVLGREQWIGMGLTLGEGCEALPKGLVCPVEQMALPSQPSQGTGPGRRGCRGVPSPHQVHPAHSPDIR